MKLDPAPTGHRSAVTHDAGRRIAMLIRVGIAVLLVGVVAFIDPITNEVAELVRSTTASWLLLAIALQIGSMIAFAQLQQRVLARAGTLMPLSRSVAIALAANAVSVTIPIGGTSASAAFTYRQYVRHGAAGTMASWTMVVSGLFSTTALALLLSLGAVLNGNDTAVAAGLTSLVTVSVPVGALAVALHSPRARHQLRRLVVRTLSAVRSLTSRPRRDPVVIVSEIVAQVRTYRLCRRHVFVAGMLATLNWVLDALCLWAAMKAFDVSLPLASLSLVYSAVIAAAGLSITPAGIGTVEAAIAVAATQLGAQGGQAVAAAIAYRVIGTWIVLLIGWITLVALRNAEAPARAPSRGPRIDHAWCYAVGGGRRDRVRASRRRPRCGVCRRLGWLPFCVDRPGAAAPGSLGC